MGFNKEFQSGNDVLETNEACGHKGEGPLQLVTCPWGVEIVLGDGQ